jgi:hypothetical protein
MSGMMSAGTGGDVPLPGEEGFWGSLFQWPFKRVERSEDLAKRVVEQSATSEPVRVDVRLLDQNGLRLPARTEVNNVGKNAAGRR